MCLNIWIPNNHHFPFGTNERVVVLGVPILKHFRVNYFLQVELQDFDAKHSQYKVMPRYKVKAEGDVVSIVVVPIIKLQVDDSKFNCQHTRALTN